MSRDYDLYLGLLKRWNYKFEPLWVIWISQNIISDGPNLINAQLDIINDPVRKIWNFWNFLKFSIFENVKLWQNWNSCRSSKILNLFWKENSEFEKHSIVLLYSSRTRNTFCSVHYALQMSYYTPFKFFEWHF